MIDKEKIIRQWEGIIDQIEQGNMRRPITTTLIYDTFALLKEQTEIIDRYRKADAFLYAHGWRWDRG